MAADNGPVVDAPMTMAEFFASLKDELKARYRNRLLSAVFIALVASHWKIFAFVLIGRHTAEETIGFIEAQLNVCDAGLALLGALTFTLVFPWVDLWVSQARAFGERRCHDFQFREQESRIQRKKKIAEEEGRVLRLDDENRDKNLLKDIENHLRTLRFSQRLKEACSGSNSEAIKQSIGDYVDFVSAPEFRFKNPETRSQHIDFKDKAGILYDALLNSSLPSDDVKEKAKEVDMAYRKFLNHINDL